MDAEDTNVSRVLVLGADSETRTKVLRDIFKLCGQEFESDVSKEIQNLTLKTKYYTADLQLHVHAVEANELVTPLAHDAEEYEAIVWVVDASSDRSFLETEQFVGNSIEELDFNVSLLVGTNASTANLAQLKRLEQWGQTNGFEFVAIEDGAKDVGDDPLHEKRGMERVKEALECNMWASLKKLDKPVTTSSAPPKTDYTAVAANDDEEEEASTPSSKILVLGSDVSLQHEVLGALTGLSGGHKTSEVGETVQELQLKTKYYEADVEFHLHRVETNELVTALHHDVDAYEALLWVADASSDRSFREVQQFIERSMEELAFEVCLLVGTRVDQASTAQVEALRTWCLENGFEFVEVPSEISSEPHEGGEKEGIERVLEALHCNMWRSIKMLPRETEPEPKPAPSLEPSSADEGNQKEPATLKSVGDTPPPTPTTAPALSDDERLQATLAAFSGAGCDDDDDPDMQAFSGLLSQVQRIRETGAALSGEERRRQAERVAMQLWNLLGADDSDEGCHDSD